MKNFKSILLGLCLLSSVQFQNTKAAASLGAYGYAGVHFFEMSMLPLGFGFYSLSSDYGGCKLFLCADKALGLASLGLGLLLLDEETGIPSFSEVTREKGEKLGLTKIQREAFNASRTEINIIKDEMVAELVEMENPTMEDANRMWNDSKDLLDADAFSALEIIRKAHSKK